MKNADFKLIIHGGLESLDATNDNVDVVVELSDGDSYAGTFFTLENIRSIIDRYQQSGECSSGLYFWAADMIIVSSLSEEDIRKTVGQLILDDELKRAMSLIPKT